MRRPRTALLLAPLLAVALTGCGDDHSPGAREHAGKDVPVTSTDWIRLPDLPLSSRYGPVVAAVGDRVLAIGGETGDSCPPNADCAVANESGRDGAVLDLRTRRWRAIADAPVDVPAYSESAVVGEDLYLLAGGRLLAYDLDADRWRTVRRLSPWYSLEPDGDRLLLVSGSDEGGARDDLVHDPATGLTTALPEDPLGPSFSRGIVPTPRGLLLVAHPLVDNPGGGDQPSYVEGALLDRATGRWTRLPASDQLGGGTWAAVGDRVVNLALDSTDGGGDPPGDYGRKIPFGGRLDLATSTWSPLPDPPAYLTGGWVVDAPGPRLIAGEGWLYDDTAGTFTKVPRPEGGAVQPGPAVWAGDELVVVGGTNQRDTNAANRDARVWAWEPAARRD